MSEEYLQEDGREELLKQDKRFQLAIISTAGIIASKDGRPYIERADIAKAARRIKNAESGKRSWVLSIFTGVVIALAIVQITLAFALQDLPLTQLIFLGIFPWAVIIWGVVVLYIYLT